MQADGYTDKKGTLEAFKAALDDQVEQTKYYRNARFIAEEVENKSLSVSDWLESCSESYEALFETHEGDVEAAIASLTNP